MGTNHTSELLNSQNFTEETIPTKENYSAEDKLTTFEDIKNSPFHLVGNDTKGYFAVMGKFQITPNFMLPEQVTAYIADKPYELLITMMSCVYEHLTELKNNIVS